MRKLLMGGCILAIGLSWVSPARADCICDHAKVYHAWCSDCKVGYFDGVKVSSKKLFEVLDGKYTSSYGMECESCKKAFDEDSYCDKCKVGYYVYKAYKSKQGYLLSRGKSTDLKAIKCETCKKNGEASGWCKECNVGMVGCCSFKDKEAYEQGVKARVIVSAAAGVECEGCAIAMVTDGTCESCKVSFKDGKKVE